MMREILFRGKRIDNGEWVYGFYMFVPKGRFSQPEHMIQTISEDGRMGLLFDIDPETIGQYTSLKDKHGKMIFEGDILKSQFGSCHVWYCTLEDGAFALHRADDKNMSAAERKRTRLQSYCCKDDIQLYGLTRIGNIHDNPELLEANHE